MAASLPSPARVIVYNLLYHCYAKKFFSSPKTSQQSVRKLGLGAFLVERSFFPENERNDQVERSHRSEKNERSERVLKNFGMITERNGTGIA